MTNARIREDLRRIADSRDLRTQFELIVAMRCLLRDAEREADCIQALATADRLETVEIRCEANMAHKDQHDKMIQELYQRVRILEANVSDFGKARIVFGGDE